MAEHDLFQSGLVGRSAAGIFHHLGHIAEILGTKSRRSDDTKHLRILAGIVVKAMNGPAGNAKRLTGADIELLAIHSPG